MARAALKSHAAPARSGAREESAMPIETVAGAGLTYYLIAFDGEGRERTDDPDGLMSQRAGMTLGQEPITDVFIFSHGWLGDLPSARGQYHSWIAAMAARVDDIERMRRDRPAFKPLLIGLHWPSLPWGDEVLAGSAVSFSLEEPSVEEQVDDYAARLVDTPAARAALTTILTAAQENPDPPALPPAVRDAYAALDRELALSAGGVGAPPGADREPFDAERSFRYAAGDAVSFGGLSFRTLLVPLQQASFWTMKDRARQFGESGGHALLTGLQRTAGGRDVRFHLMGHSFGCIVASATVAGPDGRGALPRPVNSVALVQGALSHGSYCADIPARPGQPGYFRALVDGRVAGPIITTQSVYDTAVGRFYPMAAGVRGQVSFDPNDLPTYGALGAYGARGAGVDLIDLDMQSPDAPYAFAPGKIYNLEGSGFIREGGGPSGAHGDILGPAVTHAVWEAARQSG
jgi:hypothetical protein